LQGPAQEETLPVSPKPTQELPTNLTTQAETMTSGDAPVAFAAVIEPMTFTEPGKIIPLKGRAKKQDAADGSAVNPAAGRLMTAHPKPEKRKNAKERAKERNDERNKDRTEAVEVAAVVPEISGLSTAHPKPEKRLNAKERAKAKFAKKDDKKDTKKDAKGRAADGTTPMTAKAKSKGDTKAKKTKAAEAA
jgi:hypothetical protein